LEARDFHVFVDGTEQRIQSVTLETQSVGIRDNRGFHWEHSETPTGIWSLADQQLQYVDDPRELPGDLGNRLYVITFAPDKSAPAGCHKIRVKVDRPHSVVDARDEYCTGQSPSDTLKGSKLGNRMEQEMASSEPGKIALFLQTGFFYTGTDTARVRISLEFPTDSLNRWWESDWALHATIGALGIVYKQGGSLATRFSDFGCCSGHSGIRLEGMGNLSFEDIYHPKDDFVHPLSLVLSQVEKELLPTRYETQVELAPGEYDLRVVLSDGEKFGRAEAHLNIDKYDGRELGLSSVMLCKRFRDAHVAAVEAAAANQAPQYVPLVSKDIQVTPTGDTRFKPGEPLIAYFELYLPSPAGQSGTQVQAHLRVVDAKTGQVAKDFPPVDAASYMQAGKPAIPIAREIPIDTLPKGSYRLELQATDSTGKTTPWRTAAFTVE
jgi:hypothetical protein